MEDTQLIIASIFVVGGMIMGQLMETTIDIIFPVIMYILAIINIIGWVINRKRES